MATKTLGTNATTSLTAVLYAPGYGSGLSAADIATIALGIKDDQNVTRPVVPGSFVIDGLLFVPNRGVLKVFPGDFVGVDSRGWPILISKDTAANGPWTHT